MRNAESGREQRIPVSEFVVPSWNAFPIRWIVMAMTSRTSREVGCVERGTRNAECGMKTGNYWRDLAVLIDETVMATSSSASSISLLTASASTSLASTRSSIQYMHSSHSSSTMPILARKSARD